MTDKKTILAALAFLLASGGASAQDWQPTESKNKLAINHPDLQNVEWKRHAYGFYEGEGSYGGYIEGLSGFDKRSGVYLTVKLAEISRFRFDYVSVSQIAKNMFETVKSVDAETSFDSKHGSASFAPTLIGFGPEDVNCAVFSVEVNGLWRKLEGVICPAHGRKVTADEVKGVLEAVSLAK